MLQKMCLLLAVGVCIFITYCVSVFVYVLVKARTRPEPVQLSQADFVKLLEAHRVSVHGVSEVQMDGWTSSSVFGTYKNPHPPGGDIDFQTDWVKGSNADLMALLKKYPDTGPTVSRPKLTPKVMLVRAAPYVIFFMIACVIFQREIALIFRPRE